MRKILLLLLAAAFAGCRQSGAENNEEAFRTEALNGFTPIKNQGGSGLCWLYAMLSTIETEHIMRGDSVSLSADYVIRQMLMEHTLDYYLAQGSRQFGLSATPLELIRLISTYGIVPYDACHQYEQVNYEALNGKLHRLADRALRTRLGISRCATAAERVISEALGGCPTHVFMYRAEYTPLEFAHSVCSPDEYVALTSFKHHSFYQSFALEIPDNQYRDEYYNLPIDSLTGIVFRAVRQGHGVCWEGDVTEEGCDLQQGIAQCKTDCRDYDEQRLRDFERHFTTDDHCMSIVGIARDKQNKPYFILKNSAGTETGKCGLVYMSVDYFKLKTVAVVLGREAMEWE